MFEKSTVYFCFYVVDPGNWTEWELRSSLMKILLYLKFLFYKVFPY